MTPTQDSGILSPAQVAEIKARRDAITPVPWTAARLCDEDGTPYGVNEFVTYVRGCADVSGGKEFLAVLSDGRGDVCHTGNGPNGAANTHFLANAPTDIDALLASHESLRARVAALEDAERVAWALAQACCGTGTVALCAEQPPSGAGARATTVMPGVWVLRVGQRKMWLNVADDSVPVLTPDARAAIDAARKEQAGG